VNYGVIALASGLSVLLPLLCVCIIQCVKQHRIKRHNQRQTQARQLFEQIPSVEVNPQIFNGPPTYESIFGSEHSDSEQLVHGQTLEGHADHDNAAFVHENENHSNSRSTGIFQISGTRLQEGNVSSSNITGNSNNSNQRPQSSSVQPVRFPGMHLSMADIFIQNGCELTTPPPTYGDALKIIGEFPPNYTENKSAS